MRTIDPPLSGILGDRKPEEFSIPGLRSSSAQDLIRRSYNLKNVLLGDDRLKNSWEGSVSRELKEVHRETLAMSGTAVPFDALCRRDLTASGTGPDFVQTMVPPSIADALLPFSLVVGSGGTVLDGLRGNPQIPRFSLPSTPQVLGETAAVTPSDPNMQAFTLKPHRISTRIILSKQLLLQAAGPLEDLLRKEILRSIGAMIDSQALNGTGVAPQPLGLLHMPTNAPGGTDLNKLAPPVTFGGPASWAKVVSFETAINSANVVDDGTFGWGLSPTSKEKWSTAPRITGYPSYLCEEGRVNNSPERVSTNLSSSNQAVFARWSDVVIGLWAMTILADHITLANTGRFAITATIFMDVNVMRGPAVCVSSDSAAQ